MSEIGYFMIELVLLTVIIILNGVIIYLFPDWEAAITGFTFGLCYISGKRYQRWRLK